MHIECTPEHYLCSRNLKGSMLMKTQVNILASWTYNGVDFSVAESVNNLRPASSAPDTCLLTFDGFRTYKKDGHVYIEVTNKSKMDKAVETAQRIYATPRNTKNWEERRIRSLEKLEAYQYKMSLYGPEYAKQYDAEKDNACETGVYGIRIVDTSHVFIDGFDTNDSEENKIVDIYDDSVVG